MGAPVTHLIAGQAHLADRERVPLLLVNPQELALPKIQFSSGIAPPGMPHQLVQGGSYG